MASSYKYLCTNKQVCKKCSKTKSLLSFHDGTGGYFNVCKICRNKEHKKEQYKMIYDIIKNMKEVL